MELDSSTIGLFSLEMGSAGKENITLILNKKILRFENISLYIWEEKIIREKRTPDGNGVLIPSASCYFWQPPCLSITATALSGHIAVAQ